MSGHTPGPWIAIGYRIWGPLDPGSKHANGRMMIGGVVDDLHDWRGELGATRDERALFAAETAANARLMAAAPKMLEALRQIAQLAADRKSFVLLGPRAFAEAQRIASGAILKATGGAS